MAIKVLQTTTEKQLNTNANQLVGYNKDYETQLKKYQKMVEDNKSEIGILESY